ncbi:pseudouridine synthase [Tepidibacillus marianensis]|uniref:pseudouridine synthase n=1 Tax=Tepidibacillus marianensis TaxID=3131995 RepID=UPI0030D3F0B3
MQRLQKVIAEAGLASRRKAEQLIIEGKVIVNEKIAMELGMKVDPSRDRILVNGKEIKIVTKKIVVLLNKPKKVITSTEDPQGRKTVLDLIHMPERIYPVGRLDYDTEGLLLLTNDGELANRLMHPRYELDKTYEVIVHGTPTETQLDLLRRGILLDDGLTSQAQVKKVIINNEKRAKIHITIHEGRNRQVRRMFQTIGYPVIQLKRIQYGFLTLKNVNNGEYRILTKEEVCQLRKIVKLSCLE